MSEEVVTIKLSKGQKMASDVTGLVAGCGASALVAGLLGGIVDSIPGVGPVLKVLLNIGAVATGATVGMEVQKHTNETVQRVMLLANVAEYKFKAKLEQKKNNNEVKAAGEVK